MKLVKALDQKSTTLLSDPINQIIVKNLVRNEQSISQLATQLDLPTLKLWRRMQKLLKANVVELSRTEKVGNIERKLYRATATRYVPQQPFNFKPKDANLQAALKIYMELQNNLMAKFSAFGEIPEDVDPVDFAVFASMKAFTQVYNEPETPAKLDELSRKLSIFDDFLNKGAKQ